MAYRKGTADEAVLAQSFDRDIFFHRVPEYQPRDGDVVIDIGAHIGGFAILASTRVGRGRVHAIEASEDTCNLLRINVALNRRPNITVHHLALTDRDGTATLRHGRRNWGYSISRQFALGAETVPSSTLATFLEKNQIGRCSFLKLNCEGAEFPILLGAPPKVLGRIDLALVLYHADLWKANTGDDLVSHLQAAGFTCVIRDRTEHRGWLVATRS
jgi:FkbM family methyltransferase